MQEESTSDKTRDATLTATKSENISPVLDQSPNKTEAKPTKIVKDETPENKPDVKRESKIQNQSK